MKKKSGKWSTLEWLAAVTELLSKVVYKFRHLFKIVILRFFILESNLQKLVEKRIPVECCLSSNVKCGTVPTYDDHHFKYFLDNIHPVVICVSIYYLKKSFHFCVISCLTVIADRWLRSLRYNTIQGIDNRPEDLWPFERAVVHFIKKRSIEFFCKWRGEAKSDANDRKLLYEVRSE